MPQPVRSLGGRAALVVVTAIAVVLGLLSPGPASAADDPIQIQIDGFPGQSVIIDPNLNTSYPGTSQGAQVAPQCVDVPGIGRSCMGIGTDDDQVPFDVRGVEELSHVVKDADARAAIGWMVPEAVEAIQVLHDLPDDGRVERYGRPAIRAWMVLRLQDIMDRYVYGVALSDDEQRALDWLNADLAADDLVLAESAKGQFDHYMTVGCGYHPPAAPDAIEKPVVLPEDVREWCSHPHNRQVALSTFAPPIPSVKAFTEWGAYAESQALGLDVLGEAKMAENVRSAVVNGAVFGGIGVAAGIGALAGTLAIAAGTAAKIGAKIFPHAGKAFFKAGQIIAGSSSGIAGAIAAAAIAFIVVVFIVVTAVATWQLIQHDSVGKTINDRYDAARTNTDPLGLEPLRDDWSGLPVGSEYDRDDPPSYLTEDATVKTTFKVAQVTGVVDDPQAPAAQQDRFIADPEDLWTDNATRNSDFRFVKRVGNGPRTVVDSVRLPIKGGELKVRFSRGWMIVDENGRGERAVVTFNWVRNGEKVAVSRAPAATEDNWVLTHLESESGRYVGERVVNLSYRNGDDELVSIGLTKPNRRYDAGPRPSAVGPLTTGRVVNLRPNPVTPTGVSVDPAQAENDYSFDWTVSALQPDGDWLDVSTGTDYGLAFTPQLATHYRARVTMTSVVDPLQQQFGYVDFPVAPPVVTTPVLALQDNGASRLEVDLQAHEAVPGDDLQVKVTWPGDLGSTSDPTTSLALDCIQTGPVDCTSLRTGPSNLLVRTVTTQTDLRRPVTVTITNSTGGAVTRQFLIGDDRPQVTEPPADANAGLPGDVLVNEGTTQLTLPMEDRNHAYSVATLVPTVPGDGFGLVDPQTGGTRAFLPIPGTHNLIAKVEQIAGAWHVVVQGTLVPDEVGSHQIPLVVAQTNTDRALLVLVVHVVASTGERYRGGLSSNVDPLDLATAELPQMFPAVLGGRSTWPAYTGGMCVSLQHRDFGLPPRQRCGSLGDFFEPDGSARLFPYAELFPGGMSSGSYEAKAWLTGVDAEQVDRAPLWTRFFLTEDVLYGDPEIDLGRVSLAGSAVVGSRLRTRIQDVYPGGVDVTFRWLRDDRRIRGATDSTYRLTRADAGHRVKVVVTGTRSGWVKDTRASQPTSRVRRR